MGDTIRLGIVGAGENARSRHLPGLQALDGVAVVAVCNRSRESSERVAAEFTIPRVYERWTELVTAPDIDAVVIGTWPYMHCPVTLAALGADQHVMCESRMAMNAAEAHRMHQALVLRPHLVGQVVPSSLTLRVDGAIQRLLAAGYVGSVLVVEVRAGGSLLDSQSPLMWRQDRDLSGVNTLMLGIWYEAVMRWVGHATAVTAMAGTFVPMRKDVDGTLRAATVPDHIDVIAQMACGAQLHMVSSAVTGYAGPHEALIYGSEGTLRVCQDRLYGARRGESGLQEIHIADDQAGRWRVEEEFIGAIRGQEAIRLTTFADGVKYMEFTEAALRSAASGETVRL